MNEENPARDAKERADAETNEARGVQSTASGTSSTEMDPALVAPPLPDSGQTQVNVGVAVLQSMPSLDRFDKDIQHRLLDIAEQMDNHSFRNAENWLQSKTRLREAEIADGNAGRRQVLFFAGGLATLVILAGTIVTIMLIVKGQPRLAQTVMMTGLTSIGMFLGGTGIWGILQAFRAKTNHGDDSP